MVRKQQLDLLDIAAQQDMVMKRGFRYQLKVGKHAPPLLQSLIARLEKLAGRGIDEPFSCT
ncbi:hypothetical protein ABWL39_09770 [Chitinivorax sp. PXF-14]|uniref:hypothetical protein n=1 Tax=Chitinivorax sp. PXF-14 TaxID=3230488 RepID=UPI00346666BC